MHPRWIVPVTLLSAPGAALVIQGAPVYGSNRLFL